MVTGRRSPRAGRARAAVEPPGDAFHKAIVDHLADGVYYVDRERRITYWNRGAEQLTGYRGADMVGRLCYDDVLCHVDADGRRLCHTVCPLAATIADATPRTAVVWLRHLDGSRRAVSVRTAPVYGGDGEVIGGVEVFDDATRLVEAREEAAAARHDALTDGLTGLSNRRYFDALVAGQLAELERRGTPFGLLIADIDHFKRVNDEHGHLVGDEVLGVVATTLRSSTRVGDLAFRWGGEEFAIVAAGSDLAGLTTLARRVLALVRATEIPVDGRRLRVKVSVGATIAWPGDTADSIVERADRALFAAKTGGRDRFVMAPPEAADARPSRDSDPDDAPAQPPPPARG